MNTIQRYKHYTARLNEFIEWSKANREKQKHTWKRKPKFGLAFTFGPGIQDAMRRLSNAFAKLPTVEELKIFIEAEDARRRTLKYKIEYLDMILRDLLQRLIYNHMRTILLFSAVVIHVIAFFTGLNNDHLVTIALLNIVILFHCIGNLFR